VLSAAADPDVLEAFRGAGRTLFSLGLVKGSEGNLSTFDGETLWITRTGCELAALGPDDVLRGGPMGDFQGASSDLEVHRARYRESGPGALAHAHPAGTVPEDGGRPGEHGLYVFAPTLDEAVAELVASAREEAAR